MHDNRRAYKKERRGETKLSMKTLLDMVTGEGPEIVQSTLLYMKIMLRSNSLMSPSSLICHGAYVSVIHA